MELEVELEVELEAGFRGWSRSRSWIWRLERELRPKGRNPRKFQPGAPKSAFWAQTALLPQICFFFQRDFDEKWPLSKPENVLFAPGDQAIQSPLSLQVYHQKCILSGPYGRNPRGDPPIFVDFLLTNSSRMKHYPCEVITVRQVRSGRSGSGSGR